jgi:hypothetical protein
VADDDSHIGQYAVDAERAVTAVIAEGWTPPEGYVTT